MSSGSNSATTRSPWMARLRLAFRKCHTKNTHSRERGATNNNNNNNNTYMSTYKDVLTESSLVTEMYECLSTVVLIHIERALVEAARLYACFKQTLAQILCTIRQTTLGLQGMSGLVNHVPQRSPFADAAQWRTSQCRWLSQQQQAREQRFGATHKARAAQSGQHDTLRGSLIST